MNALDLDAYFDRIGYVGPRRPTLDVLRALQELHPASIPFENLSPWTGEPVAIDLASIQRKLVHGGRGGYCFEHNTLFLAALRALGFRVSGLAARVLWNQPEDAVTPRTHMLLRIELDEGSFIADAGFGGSTLTAPLRVDDELLRSSSNPWEGAPGETPHGVFRLVRLDGGDLRLEARIGADFRSLYRFDLRPAYTPDYEVANFYVSTHPNSHFRHRLIATRAPSGRRFALLNRTLTTYPVGGEPEAQELGSVQELRQALADVFLLRLPPSPTWDEELGRLFVEAAE